MVKQSFRIFKYQKDTFDKKEIENILFEVYVQGQYTSQDVGRKMFTIEEVNKRGVVVLVVSPTNSLAGMVVCGSPDNPYRQIAREDEAEMQLLAVGLEFRGSGIGSLLVKSFEDVACELGFKKAVLSTQRTMDSAHRLYNRSGYIRSPSRDWSKNGREFIVFTKDLSVSNTKVVE